MSNEKDANKGLAAARDARRGTNLYDFQTERAKRKPAPPVRPWKPYKPEDFSLDPEPGP